MRSAVIFFIHLIDTMVPIPAFVQITESYKSFFSISITHPATANFLTTVFEQIDPTAYALWNQFHYAEIGGYQTANGV